MNIVKYGRYSANVNSSMNNMVQVVDPNSNEAGAVIRTLTMSINGSGSMWLLTGPNAPVFGSGPNHVVFRVNGNSSMQTGGTLPYEVQLPSGYGLWLYASAAQSGGVNMSYDLY
ncbi:hypothetical protein GAY33_01135 [Azospirillum brasilense]|uniref:hypothetical protein n=1 Tax=Azospirillum argentinense TaxID=2970906 RepID=UPI00190A69C2|nr:hypothetical protein [Azospirillum argentinense]MBK3797858.1 hypothetical protein [Azospirillum argentinense]